MPMRIQRKREKGWKLKDHCTNPLGYVIIDRTGALGNPFDWTAYMDIFSTDEETAKAHCTKLFRAWLFRDGKFSDQPNDPIYRMVESPWIYPWGW